MKYVKPLIFLMPLLLAFLLQALPVAAQVLPISEHERSLLEIEVQTVNAVDQAGAGEITLRVAFAPDGEWAIKTPLSGVLHRVFVQEGDLVKAVTHSWWSAAQIWLRCNGTISRPVQR